MYVPPSFFDPNRGRTGPRIGVQHTLGAKNSSPLGRVSAGNHDVDTRDMQGPSGAPPPPPPYTERDEPQAKQEGEMTEQEREREREAGKRG